jgi:L-asparaginase II
MSVPLARVVRSGLVESVHLGDIAVCDADGRLVAFAGDPRRLLFARSCMKPLQAAVSLRAIPDELPDRELAVMCASHNGEPAHVGAVRALLHRAGLAAAALRCPPAWPLDKETMARSGQPHREHNNCSGKHAGMLLACVRSELDPATYTRATHPLQRRVSRAVRRATGVEDIRIGVDGCGIPVHGLPLVAMATLYARLARPERLGDLETQADRCAEAMLAQPYLVGGRGRLDTALMAETHDVLVKEGAEALVCAAALAPGLGVAVKVADGGERAAGPALVRTLALLDALTAEQRERLHPFEVPAVIGGGRPVGEIVADVELERP